MATHIALLRAINVGGRNKLPMAQLRQICAGLGWRDVATYIQSGNLVFSAEATADLSALGRSLSTAIRDQAGLDVPVVVRTRDNLVQIARDNPYPNAEPKRLSAVFLGGVPKDPSKLDLNRSPPGASGIFEGDVGGSCDQPYLMRNIITWGLMSRLSAAATSTCCTEAAQQMDSLVGADDSFALPDDECASCPVGGSSQSPWQQMESTVRSFVPGWPGIGPWG